jgi:hypothetical protein
MQFFCFFALGLIMPLVALTQADRVPLNATFYDFKTHEYLTFQETDKGPLIRYSDGIRPFVSLRLDSVKKQPCESRFEEGSSNCSEYYYIVSFINSPQMKYKLVPISGEFGSASLLCTDKTGKSLNSYEMVSEWIFEEPSILSLFRSWATGVSADSSISITIERKEKPHFIALTMSSKGVTRNLSRVSLHPERNGISFYDPTLKETIELRILSFFGEGIGILGLGVELHRPKHPPRFLHLSERR